MQSRITYSLVTTLLLTAFACARQADGELEADDPDEMTDVGGSSTGGAKGGSGSVTPKAGSTSTTKGGSGTALPPAGSTGGKSTGGSKATGGSSGTAGGTAEGGSADSGDPDPVNMPVEGLSVTFKAGEGDSADFIGGELFVTNDSAESFSLSNIKIRYYFTNELNSPPGFVWQWGQFGPSSNLGGISCTGAVVEMPAPKTGANFYVELTCPDGDFASGSQLRTSWKAGNQGSGKLTQSDDWSFIASMGEAPKVVVMDGNNIIWGTAP